MSLASRISARSRRPTATVTLGGRRWRGVISLSRSQEYGQGVSTGTVVGRDPPVTITEGETTISWSWGYDGYEVAGFSGVVAVATLDSYPNRWRLTVADELWRAEIERKDISTSPLNDIAASEAIRQILGGAGITRMSIPELSASGSEWAGTEWVMGTLTPVSFENTTALAAAQSIAATLGYWLYCDAAGVVRAVLMERRPSSSPFRTLTWGVDFLLTNPHNRTRDAAAVRNRVVVRGANTGVGAAQIFDEWVSGAGNRSFEATYPLIEYVNESEAGEASIVGVAKRLIRLWSRQPNVITVGKLKADPRIGVGTTLGIVCAPLGYTSSTPFFVYRLQTSLDLRAGAFDQSLTLDGGTGDQGYTTIPPPLAAMSWRIVREALDGVGVVELFLDGSGSQSLSSGEIVSWEWASATATQTPFPDTATGVRAMFVYPAATTTATVTLTVTDTSSKIGTLEQTIDLAGDALTTPEERVISIALGSAWAATPDGGQTWNVEATGDSTLVPEFGGDELISTAGTGSTSLRRTGDALASASTALASLGGQITALSQTRDAPDRVWAAVGANLFKSTDGGETFAAWGTLPATIVDVLEDPALFDSVFVLSGNTMYQSTSASNPGTAWVPLYVGPTGATARQLVRGLSGATTWIAYTGTFTGSPLHRVEGPLTVAFPLSASPAVEEIRAIAMNDAETELYAWDADGRIWIIDAQTGVGPTESTQSHDPAETVQHALHDPEHPIVYVATFGATEGTTYKYFPLTDTLATFYVPAAGQQAHRVGIGGAAEPEVELLVITGSAVSPGGVWHLTTGGWQLKNTGLPAGWNWHQIATSPTNPNDWLLAGVHPSAGYTRGATITSDGQPILYRTTDAGLTWTPVDIPDLAPSGSFFGFGTSYVPTIGYTDAGQLFAFSAYSGPAIVYWYGAAALTGAVLLPSGSHGFHGAVGGVEGQIVVTYRDAGTDRYGYITPGDTAFTPVGLQNGSTLDVAMYPYRPSPFDQRAGLIGPLGKISGAASYRTTPTLTPTLPFDTAGDGVAAAALTNGSVYIAFRGDGVLRVTGLWDGAPTEAGVVAAAGSTMRGIVSDPQTRTAVAAIQDFSGTIFYSTDGEMWGSTTSPSGGDINLATLAIIVRTG